MQERPVLSKRLSRQTFQEYYYLKSELMEFCRANGLPASGGKAELTDRITHYLDTGRILPAAPPRKKKAVMGSLEMTSIIETGFVCTEKHRAFFKHQIGDSFTFCVAFQKWLKGNAGKTYGDAIAAYRQILREQRKEKTRIDRQFEYNAYIRAFFADNKGRILSEAIQCWKYKKQMPGHNQYERSDLKALLDAL